MARAHVDQHAAIGLRHCADLHFFGELANGFISVGGASTPELASDTMKEFVDRYTKMFGEYNDESNKQQRKPNIVRGLFSDVIDSPRLSGTAWMMLADPNLEPVIEVAFLNGVQTPTLEQEINFRTDGVAWKVVHRYGVGAVGFKGAIRNAGQ